MLRLDTLAEPQPARDFIAKNFSVNEAHDKLAAKFGRTNFTKVHRLQTYILTSCMLEQNI